MAIYFLQSVILAGVTRTSKELCQINEQSDCTSNPHSAKNYPTESLLMTEEDTSVPISECNTADKGFQISFSSEADGETSVPISTADNALQVSLASDSDTSPVIVFTRAKKHAKGWSRRTDTLYQACLLELGRFPNFGTRVLRKSAKSSDWRLLVTQNTVVFANYILGRCRLNVKNCQEIRLAVT